MLGGISGYAAAETTDEDPERVAFVGALAWAYLRSNLYPGATSWDEAVAAIGEAVEPLGKVESK
jgi:hypothetical protein